MKNTAFVVAVILGVIVVIAGLYGIRASSPSATVLASPVLTAAASVTATRSPEFAVPKTSSGIPPTVICGVVAENPIKTGQGSGPNTFELHSLAGDSVVLTGTPSGMAPPTIGSYLCGRFIGGAPMSGLAGIILPGEPDYVPPTYVNKIYQFSVVLPEPYRRSDKLSFSGRANGHPAAQDAFTARSPADDAIAAADTSCETACPVWNYVAHVAIFTDVPTRTPRQWFDGGGAGHAVGETTEDVTIDGRLALKLTNGAGYPLQYIVADRGRMFRFTYTFRTDQAAPAGASKVKLDAILASITFVP